MEVVGTIFIKDNKILLVKPRRRPTYQLPAGKVEEGETTLQAAIRECHEELGKSIIFHETKFKFIMEFNEIASSDNVTQIHYSLFMYEGVLEGTLEESEEIEYFIWYEANMGTDMLSNTLRHVVIPYCIENNLIV